MLLINITLLIFKLKEKTKYNCEPKVKLNEFDFSDVKVLLIGDFMVDHYVIGNSNRMSPEAPVPVVIPEDEYFIPRGAGNVALNLSKMRAKVIRMGAVGQDTFGESLIQKLKRDNVNTEFIEVIANHTTTLKQRIYCNGTQIARVDKENCLMEPKFYKKINYTLIMT